MLQSAPAQSPRAKQTAMKRCAVIDPEQHSRPAAANKRREMLST